MVLSFFGRNGGTPPAPPELAQLRAYWEALREAGALPARSRINPRGIAGVLDKVVLIERVAPGIARLRIAGMAIRDLADCEVVGMPLSALFEPGARGTLADAVEALFSLPCTIELEVAAERSLGRPALSGRMLLLPLQGFGGVVDMAIGALVMTAGTARAPRRLTVTRVQREALVLGEPAPRPPRLTELAEDAPRYAPRPNPRPAERPYLRLVKTDREPE